MHQRTDKKKIALYVFFFLFFSTISNTSLNNLNFSKISKINISGLSEKENQNILNEIKLLNLNNIFFLNKNSIKKIIDKNTSVENFFVKKNYPFELDIKIIKTNFLANISKENKNYLIGSNGKLTLVKKINYDLPIVYGVPKTEDFIKLKKIVEKSDFEFSKISSLYFFKSKRWDIKTNDKILIKLPRNNIQEAIKQSYDILSNNKFLNIKIIDLRIENQVIINDK